MQIGLELTEKSAKNMRYNSPSKFHQNLLRIDWEIGEKHAIQVNLTAV